MKQFSISLFVGMLLLFSGCFGDDAGEIPEAAELQKVAAYNVSLQKPASWNFVTREESPLDLPQGVLMLASAVEPWGAGETFSTVAVAREELPTGVSEKKYVDAAATKTKKEIVGYSQISEEGIDIQGQEGKLLRFQGRNSIEGTIFEWFHLFVAKGDFGYVISGTTPTDASEDQKNLLRAIVTSYRFEETQE